MAIKTKKETKNNTKATKTAKLAKPRNITKPMKAAKTVKPAKSAAKKQKKAKGVKQPKKEAATVSAPAAAFGSPERLRELAGLANFLMLDAINKSDMIWVGPFTEIKHALYELASIKEQLAAGKVPA